MMLPKCVLPSTKSKGRHLKQTPINYLCDLWSKNEFGTLWNLAKGRAIPVAHESHGNDKRRIESAVSMARAGLFGKASRLLLSSGLAPNTDTTWQLLLSKHPSCPPPVAPLIPSTPATIGPDFNMLAILHSFPKDTAAGPSGLRIQHLLDAATIPLPTSICSALRDVVNLLASGNVPSQVSTYLAGGSLTALNKVKPGCPPDIRPIAVGETLRRLTGKCLCAVIKDKASELFHPLQFGVACTAGSEKIIHGLRKCIEDHWDDEDFVVLKVDMRNAFNLVSRQAILDECASLFPELLPWVLWCYGTHSALWHPMGRVSSESGVQQGDPLGPLLFALVLQKIISAVDVDVECIEMLFNAWFLDYGVLAGPKSAVLRAMHLIEELGPSFGIFINLAKCELYSRNELSSTFPVMIKSSQVPHLELLGAPIGDFLFCSKFIASRRKIASKLLSKLEEVASIDPQVALILLRLCGGFCKMVHVARTTPPHLAFSSLESFDSDVRMCFSNCVATDISDVAWKQAQLGLSYGGLGLRSISHHSCAAYIASLSFSGLGSADNPHLMRSIVKYNGLVSPPDGISVESILASPIPQRILSQRLDDHSFGLVIAAATDADKARLLSTSAPHATSWLSVVPSIGLGLHLDPNELQIPVKWWLGLDTSRGSSCGLCPDVALDPLGHHAATCRRGGDVVIRHNRLRDVFLSFCHQAHIAARLEAGSGLTPGLDRARPADVLVRDWAQGKPAAFDITVTSPLTPAILAEASRRVDAAAEAAENRKHTANDPKCAELGWRCVPLAVETYCNWGEEARGTFALLATRLAFGSSSFRKARVISDMFGRLNITLVRAIARAILARTVIPSDFN